MNTATAPASAEATDVLDPCALLDFLLTYQGLKNDVALARELRVAPPVISKVRHGRISIGATLLIAMHELTGKSVSELRGVMGDRRARFRDPEAA